MYRRRPLKMSLDQPQIEAIVAEEVERWKRVHADLSESAAHTSGNLEIDRARARELTAELVTSRNEEDKVQLSSDEAVAHGLSRLRQKFTKGFEGLLKQPYFARVVTREGEKTVEFFLGTASFPKHRIVDWRKAPISQLYYNYRQGDEFDEIIQGRERSGVIEIRRGYKGLRDELSAIEIPEGIIQKKNGTWVFEERDHILSRSAGHDGHLPPILSLITKDQYELISHSPKSPVIVQGIAGSGKTTVALHRLAWLLHKDNDDNRPERCLVVVFNKALKAYIETTLPELGINGVAIRTYHQWLGRIAKDFGGGRPYAELKNSVESERFKSSPICLGEIYEYVQKHPERAAGNFDEDLFRFYGWLGAKEIFWPKWQAISKELSAQAKDKLRDQQDDSVLLNLVFAREGCYPCKSQDALCECDHIVIDEAQDFGVVEIRAMLGALGPDKTVTIVGDIAQKIVANRHFGSWEELLAEAGFAETTPIQLNVSHRSTEEIMAVAAHLRSDVDFSESSAKAHRHGPAPTLIPADSYETEPHHIGKWIGERVKEDPNSLTAVICRLPKQAERLTEVLKKIGYPFVRWGHRDSFDFSPGVTITSASQVKGLEFRNVLVVNPTEEQYDPSKDHERSLLYVAVTRAELRLDFICKGRPTRMLPVLARRHIEIL